MEDPTRFSELDWREQLLRAIAYKITERQGVEPETTRNWVRDAMKRGASSEHFAPVAEAIQEMFQPLFGTFLPFVPHLVRTVATVVQQENIRGSRAEAKIQAEQRAPKTDPGKGAQVF